MTSPEATIQCLRCGVGKVHPTLAEDFERYHELQSRMRSLIEAMGIDYLEVPDVQRLWEECEEIKNRHGGMPPRQTFQSN